MLERTMPEQVRTQKIQGRQVRYIKADQMRAIEEDGKKFLRGYALLFNTQAKPYRGWDDLEEIAPEALEGLDLSDMRALVNHNPDLLLGRVGKNARFEVDSSGLFVEVELHQGVQFAKDYYQLIKAGIMDGMSFAFLIEKYEYDTKKNLLRVTKISDLWEVSFVTFPAYPQTVAIARERQKPDMGLAPAAKAEPETDTRTTEEAEPPADMGPEPEQEERQEEQANEPEPTPVDAQERAKVLAALELAIGGKPDNA